MTKLSDVCSSIRSKNAGPFWITVDLFFQGAAAWERYAQSPALAPDALGRLLGVPGSSIKSFLLPDLGVIKISYPRPRAQGGPHERDMHGGQQYVRLLDLEL